MRTIEIDFDVYKALTLKRETEDVSYNDVFREILGLGSAPIPNASAEAKSCSSSTMRILSGSISLRSRESRAVEL